MIRFTNPTRSTYHNDAITEFSDISHFIACGVVRGYASNKYLWVADFLSKHSGNLSINKHIGRIAFYSERDMFQQEYGNVVALQEQYPFISDYDYATLPKHYLELSTKQYFKIGQKFSEYDIVQYVNYSDLFTLVGDGGGDILPAGTVDFHVRHGNYRSPVFYAQGYKLNLSDGSLDEYHDRYLWTNPNNISPEASGKKSYIVGEEEFEISLLAMYDDMYDNSDAPDIIGAYPYQNLIERLLDYKIHVDNPELHYFYEEQNRWTINHNNSSSGTDKYYPYIGMVQCFNDNWEFITPYYNWDSPTRPISGFFNYYPEVTQNGVIEPAKTIIAWGNERTSGAPISKSGVCVVNPGTHLGDPDDQSRITYNISKHMTRWDGGKGRFVVEKHDFADDPVIFGVDVDTERNRRYSSVVTTEPFYQTKPIGNGQLAKISFVDYNRDPIQHEEVIDFIDNPSMYLKIKAPLTLIKELDRYLNLNEINTDIIDTLVIKNPRADMGKFYSGGDFYENLGPLAEDFLFRQEFCLDDLVGGRIGVGHHVEFYVDAFGPRVDKYSDDKMKVSGMGFVCKTNVDSNGKILPSHSEYLHVYCNNYSPVSTPDFDNNNPDESIPNVEVEIINDSSIVSRVQQYEKFRPVIKLPGVNGYVKILERNSHFKVRRAKDGDYEVIYNVEFPFCPGSAYERITMNYSDDHPYLISQILYKAAYINAGSQEAVGVGEEERYDTTNERYGPYGDDSFTRHELFVQYPVVDNFNNVEGLVHYYYDQSFTLENSEYHSEIIRYPATLIWEHTEWNLLSLIKSQIEEYRKYGTYELNIDQARKEVEPDFYLPYYSSDLKLVSLADNRQWKFDKDKYSSFINRENPAYVCEMDITTLFADFQSYQVSNGAIPDVKRWIYGYFSGFAHMMSATSGDETRRAQTVTEDEFLTTQDSESNIVIEVWDDLSDVGNGNAGNWRPLSIVSSDSNKVAGEVVIDKLFIVANPNAPEDPIIINEFGDIWSFYLGYADIDYFPFFPPDFDISSLVGKSNLVLSDSYGLKNYHIIYIGEKTSISGINEVFKIWVRYDDTQSDLFVSEYTVVDPSNVPETWGVLSVHKPEKYLSKNSNFSLTTNIPSPNILTEDVKRYIDLKSQEGIPDFNRYVNSDNKILFRIRVRRNSDYPVNYIDEDTSDIQYLGSDIETGDEWMNFPWGDGAIFDSAFDWGKITTLERLRKLGLTYFKCASR